MPTDHNEAKKGDIAKTVLMCGDPLRAKYIADNYLENVRLVNRVRNMFCYTGFYKGHELSVMGSGMGCPSIGIYSYELYNMYDVDAIIRVGTCGSYQPEVKVRDVIVAVGASSDSNYGNQFNLNGVYSAVADFELVEKCYRVCKEKNYHAHFGNVLTSDVFYRDDDSYKKWADLGILAVEMESYALYINAGKAHKKALTIMTVSDSMVTKEATSHEDREKGFRDMMEVALEVAIR